MTTALDFGMEPKWTREDRLRKAREVTGLSQPQFAQELGISTATVSKAERGIGKVSRPILVSWSFRSGVSLSWILDEETPSPDGNGVSDPADTAPVREKWAPRDSNPKPAD